MCFQRKSDFRLSSWTLWKSVSLSSFVQTSTVVSLSLSQNRSFPAHNSATCSAFWTYLCNSPSFCIRQHKTSSGDTFIQQKLFFGRGVMLVACLGESWWTLLTISCLCAVPRSILKFYDTKWATLSGSGVCRAWKHQKLNSNGWQSVQGETVFLKCVSGCSDIMSCFLNQQFCLIHRWRWNKTKHKTLSSFSQTCSVFFWVISKV